jgi:acyl carrier protein
MPAANLPIIHNKGLPGLPFGFPRIPPSAIVHHSEMSEGENTVMGSAAEDIVQMITGRISPTSGALQLSEPLDKLGLDSMQVVELIFDIEEKFDINLPVNANMDIESKTVGDLIQAVDQLVAAKAKPN